MKKLKWGLLTCLTVTSSVIPVLSTTACGKKTPEVNKIGADYDKEYGVDQAVYTKMKNEFWNKVQTNLHREGATEAEIERQRKDLNETFREYDNQLSSKQLSYTAVTNAMIDFASQMYGIRLTRQTSKKTATWDDLTSAFEGMVQSMNQYMIGSNIPEVQRATVIQKAREDFVGNGLELENNPGLLPRIKAQYDDPLMGLVKAKAELLSCFSEMNYDIGLVASSNRLKNFLEDYEITYDKRDDQSNKLDKLEAHDWFKAGADLSVNSNITKIYKITRKSDNKDLTTFEADKVCPGYTVKPILKKVNKDARTNSYTLDIDWTCVKTIYLKSNDSEKVEKTTAHYFKPNPTEMQEATEEGITNAYDTLKECSKESTLSYPVKLTKEGEIKAIEDTYFNTESEDGYLSFGWDANPQDDKVNGFDALFSGMPLDRSNNGMRYEYIVDFDSLAVSGLTISYNNTTHPERATAPVRLDDLMAVSGTKSKDSVDIFEHQDQLVKDFLKNCSCWSDTITNETHTTNSGKYSATSSVYVDYNNSEFKPEEKSGGQFNSYCALPNEEINNYTLSSHSYDYLISEYNTQEDFVSEYKTNKFRKEYKSAKNMHIVESVFLTLTLLGVGLTVAKCAAPAFIAKLPIYILIIILALLGAAGQIVMMSLNAFLKVKPLGDFVDRLDEIKDSKEIDDFDDDLIQSAKDNHLCRYDQETHSIKQDDYDEGYQQFAKKSDFFEDVLPTMEYYQNISSQQSFIQCHDIIEENDVDPEEYLNEMEVWDKKGSCTITYWTLFGVTLALDLTVLIMLKKNPELSDWKAMKEAEAKSRQTGEASQSIVESYKEIKKAKDELKALVKANKAANYCNAINETTPRAAQEALDFAKIGPEENAAIKAANEASKKFNNMMIDFDMAIDFGHEVPSVRKITDTIQAAIKSGECGLYTILGKLTRLGSGTAKIADGALLQTVFGYLKQAMNAAQNTGKLTAEMSHLQGLADAISHLTAAGKTAVNEMIKTGFTCIMRADWSGAYSMLRSFDTVICDAASAGAWYKQARSFLNAMYSVNNAFVHMVADAFDFMKYSMSSGMFYIKVW